MRQCWVHTTSKLETVVRWKRESFSCASHKCSKKSSFCKTNDQSLKEKRILSRQVSKRHLRQFCSSEKSLQSNCPSQRCVAWIQSPEEQVNSSSRQPRVVSTWQPHQHYHRDYQQHSNYNCVRAVKLQTKVKTDVNGTKASQFSSRLKPDIFTLLSQNLFLCGAGRASHFSVLLFHVNFHFQSHKSVVLLRSSRRFYHLRRMCKIVFQLTPKLSYDQRLRHVLRDWCVKSVYPTLHSPLLQRSHDQHEFSPPHTRLTALELVGSVRAVVFPVAAVRLRDAVAVPAAPLPRRARGRLCNPTPKQAASSAAHCMRHAMRRCVRQWILRHHG